MNSSFWICLLISLLCCFHSLRVYRPNYCHKTIIFLMASFGTLQADFSPTIRHYFPLAAFHHLLPVTGHSPSGSPCGSLLQLPSFRSMIFSFSFPITSFNHLILFLMSVHLLSFNYSKDTVKLHSLKGV